MKEQNLPEKRSIVKLLFRNIPSPHCYQIQKYSFILTAYDKKMSSSCGWYRRAKSRELLTKDRWTFRCCWAVAPMLPVPHIIIIKANLLHTEEPVVTHYQVYVRGGCTKPIKSRNNNDKECSNQRIYYLPPRMASVGFPLGSASNKSLGNT